MPTNLAAVGEEESISNALRLRLRALVRCLGDDPGGERSEQMLMDVDLDRHRYLLIRMPAAIPNGVSLSPREVEIVRLVAEGHPNKVIASVLEISSWTVCTHMRRVFAKFGVTSRAAMVARMASLGGVVDAALQPWARARVQEQDKTLTPRGATLHTVLDRGRVSVAPLTVQHRRSEPADAKHSGSRTVVAHQRIR